MRRLLLSAPVTIDLLDFEREAFIDEILKRTRLLIGEYDAGMSRYGIVENKDPRTTLTGDTLRPFIVSLNSVDPTTVDVSPGTAVFASGEVIVLETGASRIAIPGGLGTQSVLYLQFDEIETGSALTHWGTRASTKIEFLPSDLDYLKTLTIDEYNTLTQAERDLTIPLAQLTVQEVLDTTGLGTVTSVVVDMTAEQLSTNRPWFSPVDIEHRSYLGSGVASTANPHAVSLNDISISDKQTLFQGMLDHGMIVSKDRALAKVPGKLCEETILEAAIQADSSGVITGIRGAYWFTTTNFPTQVLRITDSASLAKDFAPLHVRRKNLVFLSPHDEYTGIGDLVITYVTTDAMEPPTDIPLTSLEFKPFGDRETVIAGGLVVNSLIEPVFNFDDAGPIPQRYIVYMRSDGSLGKYPQTCATYTKLTDAGTTLQDFEQDLVGASFLKVALQGAVLSATLSVKIEVTGWDENETILTDTIEFTSANWVDNPSNTCNEEPKQFQLSTVKFTSLSNWIVSSNVDSGPDASVSIYGDTSPRDTAELADVLPVVDVLWDGLQVCDLEDIRPINTIMALPKVTKYSSGAMALAEGTLIYRPGVLFNFWVEDFDKPKFISTKWTDNSVGSAVLPPSDTDMRKVFEGLDVRDVYVGKPMAVEPHTSTPVALRFMPIEPGRNFQLFARYLSGAGSSWSEWTDVGGFMSPSYTLNLGGATSPLVKWQVVVAGQCQGLVTTYITGSVGIDASLFVFDVGVWDNGTFT